MSPRDPYSSGITETQRSDARYKGFVKHQMLREHTMSPPPALSQTADAALPSFRRAQASE